MVSTPFFHSAPRYSNQSARHLGSQLTKKDYEKACGEKAKFMAFVRDHIVKNDSFLVLPMGKPQAMYRDDYLGYGDRFFEHEKAADSQGRSPEENGRNLQGFGFGNNAFTVLAGLPAINVPGNTQHKLHRLWDCETDRVFSLQVSQLLIQSKVNKGMIHEPISVMLVGPPGINPLLGRMDSFLTRIQAPMAGSSNWSRVLWWPVVGRLALKQEETSSRVALRYTSLVAQRE